MEERVITGERFIPEANDAELELEHFERYYSACRFVEDKVVLDAASGEGYGSYMLSKYAKKVTGVDLDIETVEAAKEKYSDRNNLTYLQGSIADLAFIETASIDVVVSFETIEHVSEEVQKEFIKEIKRVLKSDGLLIMSSPNKKEYSERYDFHNIFHVHELYVDEFIELLRTEFKNVELYRQYLEVASFIDRADIDESFIQYHKRRDVYNPEGKYVIALASNTKLPDDSFSIASLHTREEYLSTLDELNYCRAEAIKCREIIKKHERELDCRGVKIDELKNEIKLTNEELERRMTELNHRMEVINSLNADKGELEEQLTCANEELERRMTELNHRMEVINSLKANNGKLEEQLTCANEELERRMTELNHRMEVINSLNAHNGKLEVQFAYVNKELEKIKNTNIYKVLKTLKKDKK